ncbi:2'-5' RNA ligase family protein [Macrococcus brunensis]|uniref:2'-5' RNA ligase family protein n=1 Tax=Macrococcus brunensis TaxID=198483 RepID=UPI001EF11205|nr:2'-5' RNA ligase family protein [Macrococcus brunensis]ULG72660.1 2'-5' RNA ligase family protein [Macrococcus brunensis]ULG74914.1 2'-5' RNA ligase family protein [Macrococcus brunensis]
MNLGIAIFPTLELQEKINSYRKRYDSHYTVIAPHMTLKSHFEANDIDDVAQKIADVAHQVSHFDIQINKVSNFAPLKNVIYFKVEKNDELSHLHSKLAEVFGEDPHPFVPHFTIAQDLTGQEFEDVFGQLQMTSVNYSETIDKISLCYQLENGHWNVYETFKLGQ